MGLAIHRMRLKHWRVPPCQTNVASSLMTSASELRSGKTHRDENFPVASWIIHPRHRALILSFYNFVRTADDIADHATLAADEKLRLLDLLEAELLGKGDTQKEAVNLRNALAERAMPPRHALDVLIAFRMDVTKLRYENWDDVIHYCRYSAMPVGRFMLDVHGESTSTWAASDALCAGLQINNHLQDCAKDFRLGLEIAVIQAFADRIVGMLKVRDPLCERVHLSPLELLGQSLGGVAGEITRRAVGRRPVSKPAAGA